ncbi:hypothetical protein [Frankia sp. QA3]|uniref:hypothetical protein n=1 Tax=Frankia sp. QA3 TaxID=710111 RepID=UPI000269CDB9|nr:hypothetical protein [Frankia sp. QA3]EIV96596.1 hypothetical protein FraQA3DRAFT_6500 [Frankia sp. QA3]
MTGPGRGGWAGLVGPDVLWESVERMVSFGPRLPGSPAHHRHIDDLDARLRRGGLEVTRHPVRLARWLADDWSLRVVDARGASATVPVASYRPYSGETSTRGVTASVVDVGAGGAADYRGRSVRGAIVLADGRVSRLRAQVLTDLADAVEPPGARARLAAEDYSRVWLGVPAPPDLALARRHGAVAMIEILDLPPPLAAGQYTPHQQRYAGLPTLHVDREQGARLRALLALGPLRATVVLTARHDDSTVDYLLARLPGADRVAAAAYGGVLVATHTDGQNAVEENGGPALLVLAERLARRTAARRGRDVLFLFSPAHMTADAATVKPDAWLRHHPRTGASIAMALVAEHLGAMGWDERGGTAPYGPTGRSEPVVVAVGHSDRLRRLALDEVRAGGLARAGVLPPTGDGLYGEGTFPYRLGLPTVAFISGPAYLLQVGPGDQLDKLDRALLHRHTVFLARLLDRMLALPGTGRVLDSSTQRAQKGA